jgi:hypoxanthine phosphoribosyltransferase
MLKLDNKIYLSWDDITRDVQTLCEKIFIDYPNIDSVMGLPRGGMIPAVLISHELDLPFVLHPGKNTLVVDDINDTGHTLSKAPGAYWAVLHNKPTSKFKDCIYAKEVGDEWLVYPWENTKAKPMQDYLQSDEFKEFAEREDNSGVWSEEDSKLHTIGGLSNDKDRSFMKFINKINNNE